MRQIIGISILILTLVPILVGGIMGFIEMIQDGKWWLILVPFIASFLIFFGLKLLVSETNSNPSEKEDKKITQ